MASTLIQRLCQPLPDQQKLSVHAVVSCWLAWLLGQKDGSFLSNYAKLSQEELDDADTIKFNLGKDVYGANTLGMMQVWLWLLLCETKGYTVGQAEQLLGLPPPYTKDP